MDAFPRTVQAAYLDFLHDGTVDPQVMQGVEVVVVVAGSAPARAVAGKPRLARDRSGPGLPDLRGGAP